MAAADLSPILRDALDSGQAPELNLAEAIRRRFAPLGGVDLEPHPPVSERRPPFNP